MNLRGIANGATRAINPNIAATVQVSDGSTTNPDGSRVPKFAEIPFTAQVQALQYNDMVHLDGLNIQGIRRAIYLNGSIDGINRITKRRGPGQDRERRKRGNVAGRPGARVLGELVQGRD